MCDALIYEFYQPGVILKEKTKDNRDNYSYTCKVCETNIKAIKGCIYIFH